MANHKFAFSANIVTLSGDSEEQAIQIQSVFKDSSGNDVVKGTYIIQEQFGNLQIQGVNSEGNLSFVLSTKGNFVFTKEDGANTKGIIIDDGNVKVLNSDVEIENGKIKMKSPNGTQFTISVDNNGNLIVV